MTDEAKRTRGEYLRAWRAAHPGRNAEYCRRYWEHRAREKKESEKNG